MGIIKLNTKAIIMPVKTSTPLSMDLKKYTVALKVTLIRDIKAIHSIDKPLSLPVTVVPAE